MTYTEASVLADGLIALEGRIRDGYRPWAEYDGEDPAGPESEDAYRAAIKAAHALVIAAIEAS